MNTPAPRQACDRPAGPTARPGSDFEESGRGEPRLAVSQLFHLGELTATAEAIRAAHAASVQVIEAVLRHLGGDWGDVDAAAGAANINAVATEGCLRSVYRLLGTGDALIVTTNADRGRTTAALASQCGTDLMELRSVRPDELHGGLSATGSYPLHVRVQAFCQCGWTGPTHPWDSAARAAERAELTAHLASSGHRPFPDSLPPPDGYHLACGHFHHLNDCCRYRLTARPVGCGASRPGPPWGTPSGPWTDSPPSPRCRCGSPKKRPRRSSAPEWPAAPGRTWVQRSAPTAGRQPTAGVS
jgi:hypothetical protein